jgi:hypothetical protein
MWRLALLGVYYRLPQEVTNSLPPRQSCKGLFMTSRLTNERTRRPSRLLPSSFTWLASIRVRVIDHHRPRRMVGLLAILWFLGAVDLILTYWAHRFTIFYEMNPIARALLDSEMLKSLAVFKAGMLAVGTMIFWATRRKRCSEGALWALALAYVVLMFQWSEYTDNADELIRYREIADYAAMPCVVPAPGTTPLRWQSHAHSALITLAGSTPVRRMSRPW